VTARCVCMSSLSLRFPHYAPLFTPYVLHILPILVYLIWSPECHLVRNTEHNALCYVAFSTPLLVVPPTPKYNVCVVYTCIIYTNVVFNKFVGHLSVKMDFASYWHFTLQFLISECMRRGKAHKAGPDVPGLTQFSCTLYSTFYKIMLLFSLSTIL
jgi:hypothetical protein